MAPAARRASPNSIGSSRIEEAREEPDSPRLAADRARRAQPGAPARVRAADHRRARRVAGDRDLGRMARRASSALAPRVLRKPARVLRVLADLRPMARDRPGRARGSRATCSRDRLLTLDEHPPARRYGRVFVGTPHQARGRTFRVVFVPGPGRADVPAEAARGSAAARRRDARAARRRPVGQDERAQAERLLLRLAIGAATERLYLSYPRLDVGGARAARAVVLRARRHARDHRPRPRPRSAAARGALTRAARSSPGRRRRARRRDRRSSSTTSPTLRAAARRAGPGGGAGVTRTTCSAERRAAPLGHRRGGRAARSRWLPQDGLVARRARHQGDARVAAARRRGRTRCRRCSGSPPARISSCSSAIYRLEPNDEPEPLQRLDPLTRGALFHEVQAEFFRSMQARRALPVDAAGDAGGDPARSIARSTDVAAEYRGAAGAGDRARLARRDRRAPPRPARLGPASCRRRATGGRPTSSSASACSDEGRDPRSVSEPVTIDGRFILRGSVDLIERQPGRRAGLRVTDHKTGKNRSTPRTVDRRRRGAAAGALQRGGRGDPREAGRVGAAVLLHDRRRLRRARDPAQRGQPPRRRSRCSRSSTARSSTGSCRRRRPSGPAPGATSARSAGPTKSSTSRASRPIGSPISRR